LDTTIVVEVCGDAADDAAGVNGPEDGFVDWDAVQWRPVEKDVRRLRQRIFAASQAGDLKRVRNCCASFSMTMMASLGLATIRM